MIFLLAIIIPLSVCFILSGFFLPPSQNAYSIFGYRLIFTVAMYYGLTSLSYFIGRLVLGGLGLDFIILELVLFGAILGGFKILSQRIGRPEAYNAPSPTDPLDHWQKHVRIAYIALVLLTLAQIVLAYWVEAHGGWDAWAIWNLRARFLFLAGENWTRVFTDTLANPHPDYPLLLPAAVARLWHYLGSHDTLVPAITALLFCFSTIGLLTVLITTFRGPGAGLLSGVVLMGTYKFIEIGTYQIADVPLAFFFLAAYAALCLFRRYGMLRYLFLAGMMAGFAAWTKNEGLLFVIICILSYALMSIQDKPIAGVVKEGACLLGGLLPAGMMVLIFKLNYAPSNDLFLGLDTQVLLGYILDSSRYAAIAISFMESLSKIAKAWLLILPLAMILLSYKSRIIPRPFYLKTGLSIILLMMLGYAGVYLITPHDLEWHLNTSMWRLMVHVWPILLFLYFLHLPTQKTEIR